MDLSRIAWRVVIATDRSLAEAVRERLLPEILKLFPSGYFQDKLYDTGEAGKGFRPGYISFGLRPEAWTAKQLIGGILVRGTYDSKNVRSRSPEPNTPEYKEWEKAGGNPELKGGAAETVKLEAGYYNKIKGGSYDRSRSLGEIAFTIDELEHIDELELTDTGAVKSGLESLVQNVLDDPPEAAISAGAARSKSPYTSLKKFLHYLSDEGRRGFRMEEIEALSQFTGKSKDEILSWLRSRGLSQEQRAAFSY